MTYQNIDREMTIWAIAISIMVLVGLPATIITGMYLSHNERNSVEKPTAYYHLAEYAPTFEDFESTEHRGFAYSSATDHFRVRDNGKWYWSAHKHTYQVAQTITGIMLGTEGTNLNYITPYVVASICEHGEYQHVAHCCHQ